ncbi:MULTISPECIES: MEDS domain-containing protein [Sporosarcina]|uniref:MEDS domain-containing protein n=1 Tax=Sporosarcina TaxID=1569 RepID=UPI000A179FEA|nr:MULTISPECIES: MEDS domain-containing protein [Sporosarcina]ARK20867.1 hypothetical protein SporoP32a_04565 [Sporosarcina ureae]PIC73044.1 hypothetical protein CSV76_11925 [Sporosarcina sp. P17b]
MKTRIQQLIESKRNLHILYSYKDLDHHIQLVAAYIEEGVRAGEYTILIDNERIHLLIKNELQNRLNEEEMKYLHFINNFHFYYSTGSYHPATIEQYLTETVTPYVENQLLFRSWAHVEWATMDGPWHIIEDLERFVDHAVNELSFPLICAYKEESMPEHLQELLFKTHPLIIVNDELVQSEVYERECK